jgi:hypothetical protein
MNGSRSDRALHSVPLVGDVSFSREKISGRTVPRSLLLILFFVASLPLVNPWVRGDGVGYYAYLRSALIDHDFNFENDYLAGNESFVKSRTDAAGHLLPELYTKTGRVENHFSVGPAILWAPVLLPVHLVILASDRLGAHILANGYSRPYLLAMAVTTALYGFLSLLLAFRLARKYFDQQWAMLATCGIWLASSLPVYMYFNPSWSHAFSAFSVALFLWYWDRTRLQRSLGQWIILGLAAGLMGNVYYPNALLLIFPLLEGVAQLRSTTDARQRQRPLQLFARATIFFAVFVFSLLPTFITRQMIYGNPFQTGYPGLRTWNWTSPALWQVLFSSDHGMWSWTPILFFAFLGLFFLCRRDPLLGGGSLLTFVAFYYFIASYSDWDGLSSFGNRFFVSLTPIFVLGLAALFSAIARVASAARASALVTAAIVLFTVWNVGFIFQWGTHLVPARGKISWPQMVHNQFTEVPDRMTHALQTYFLHRKDMMRHIEQEDIEQQGNDRDLR